MQQDPAVAALARVRAAAKGSGRRKRPVVAPTLSSSGPDDRDPQLLGNMLTRWVSGNGYRDQIAVAGVAECWTDIVGPHVAAHAQVGSYTATPGGGELVVQADAAEWALQLRYLTGQIQRRIDERVGTGVVTSIIVRGPGRTPHSGWRVRTGRRSARPAPVVPPPEEPQLDLG